MLEYSKYFEMVEEPERANIIVKNTNKADWKTQFEAIMMQIRCGKFEEAEKQVLESLKTHFATGRLWAILIQL